jgi:hypothetical protein
MTSTNYLTDVPIQICYQVLQIDFIILPMTDFDYILEMNWLSIYHICVNCKDKKIAIQLLNTSRWRSIVN